MFCSKMYLLFFVVNDFPFTEVNAKEEIARYPNIPNNKDFSAKQYKEKDFY